MSNKNIVIIIGATVLTLFGLLFFFSKNEKKASAVSWRETYKPESKDPYGTYIVKNLLADYFPNENGKDITDDLSSFLENKNGNYVFIGDYITLDSEEINALFQFVAKGNTAFISSQYIPLELLDSLGKDDCVDLTFPEDYDEIADMESFISDSIVRMNFVHPALAETNDYSFHYQIGDAKSYYDWEYIPEPFFCEYQSTYMALGFLNADHINFAKADWGQGSFYLHTTPLVFTNYHLINKEGLAYSEKVFSHLPAGPIYWDTNRSSGFASNDNGFGGDRTQWKNGPLQYVLSQPPLAWAWYLLLGMALLYLVFRAKRRQRVIPVLEQNTNTSLEFIGSIGRLYFLQNNHNLLSQQKMKLFLGYVRERYHLNTNDLNEHFIKQLAQKSEVSEAEISRIFEASDQIKRAGYAYESSMVTLHKAMEVFYQKCK